MQRFFATCPKGLESLLQEELTELGASTTQLTVAGVYFTGDISLAYRACLWSRLANRILLELAVVQADDADMLYNHVVQIPWHEHIPETGSFLVDFVGTNPSIRNSHFGALKVKDAIVDEIREQTGERPDIRAEMPDVRVSVVLKRNDAIVSIDLSGESLHRRGYRQQQGEAPLKENLAAAILIRAGWPAMAKEGKALVDPLCGSGTILIEGALIAADIAPGLFRDYFVFEGLLKYDAALWQSLVSEAKDRREKGLENFLLWIRGYEADVKSVARAVRNIREAGLSDFIKVFRQEVSEFSPHPEKRENGLIICNPPYGERLGEEDSLVYLYRALGQKLKEECVGWQAAIITGNPYLGKQMGLRANKQYAFFNGSIPCKLLLFTVQPEWFVEAGDHYRPAEEESVTPAVVEELTAGAQMFANRLRKNVKQLDAWAKKNAIECYRLYDADMPEYSVAIDRYGDYIHVQEYAAPKSINPEDAQKRLHELMSALPSALNIPGEHIFLKQRRKQSGKQQYEKLDEQEQMVEVGEGGCRLLINLSDYLDTGLFLDHRPLRLMIQHKARGMRFLNLFCYTGSATVHAAMGGAETTTSVDMSNTYIRWAKRNMALNGFSEQHHIVQADCFTWLKENKEKFNIILLDPPTFSNSKKMDDVLDIQRDHVELIELSANHLAKKGEIYFSTNYRRFKLDDRVFARFIVEDITEQTIDKDFARNQRIHQCWKIMQRKSDNET
jgi:23S rRNA (guanine2445-N2)-methyltransferase / 23S rRNA (guanine2069-N7)-methyltransferase